MSPLRSLPPKLFSHPRGQLGLEGLAVLRGTSSPPQLWSTMTELEMLRSPRVVLKKTCTFPELFDHTAAAQKASTAPSFRFATTLKGSRMS